MIDNRSVVGGSQYSYFNTTNQLKVLMEEQTSSPVFWINGTFNLGDWNYTGGNLSNTSDQSPAKSGSPGPSHELRFICETVISMPIAILGVLGNILAFVILWRQKQRLSTNLLLQGLAVADTLVLVVNIVLRSIRYLYLYTQAPWLLPFNNAYPYIFVWLYPCLYFLRLADSLLTVLLTMDRFIAVRHPLQAQTLCTLSKAVRNMVILTIAAFVFSIPRFFEHKIDPTSKQHGFSATDLMRNEYYTIIYRIILYLLIMYFLPMVVLVVLNAKLLSTLREADNYRANVSEWRMRRANRNITAVVVTVVLVTIVCNSTAMVAHLIWSLQLTFPHLQKLDTSRRYLALVNNILITINSAINFIIYCLCSRNFTVVLARICRCYTVRMRLRKSSKQQSSSRTTYISLAHNSHLKRRPNIPLILQHGV